MKAVKIILVIAVIATIGFITWRWLAKVEAPPPPPLPPANQFTERIEKEIDSLNQTPDNRFCREFYDEINYYIDDYYKNGRFSNNPSENEQWKENFTKNLYSVYSKKFISQAFYVFNNPTWNSADLRFITAEYKLLQNSQLLEKDGPVGKMFVEIQQIINKYNEIAGFVAECKNFSYTSYSLSSHFPIEEVENKLMRMNKYINNRLENTYVNKCARLRDELKTVPQVLLNKHAGYLSEKIRRWSGMFSEFNSQSDYATNLYKPLKSEVNLLNNNIYNVESSVFNNNYDRLIRELNNDSKNAYQYFSNKTK